EKAGPRGIPGRSDLTPKPHSAHTRPIVATSPSAASVVQRLGQILLKARVLTQDVLRDALLRSKQNREKLGETLISMGAASPEEVLRALAEQTGLPFVAAEELPSAPPMVKTLPPKYPRQYMSCPIAVDGAAVTVATAAPANPVLIDDLRQMLGAKVSLCVAPAPPLPTPIHPPYGPPTPLPPPL